MSGETDPVAGTQALAYILFLAYSDLILCRNAPNRLTRTSSFSKDHEIRRVLMCSREHLRQNASGHKAEL